MTCCRSIVNYTITYFRDIIIIIIVFINIIYLLARVDCIESRYNTSNAMYFIEKLPRFSHQTLQCLPTSNIVYQPPAYQSQKVVVIRQSERLCTMHIFKDEV